MARTGYFWIWKLKNLILIDFNNMTTLELYDMISNCVDIYSFWCNASVNFPDTVDYSISSVL